MKLDSTKIYVSSYTKKDQIKILGSTSGVQDSLQCLTRSLLSYDQIFFNYPCPVATCLHGKLDSE